MTTVETRPDTTSPTGTFAARSAAWVAIAAAVAALVLAPPGGTSSIPAGAVATLEDGTLEVEAGSGDWAGVPRGAPIADGATVRAVDESAVLRLREGTLTLARGAEATLTEGRADLALGSLLVERDAAFDVTLGLVSATGRGRWRADASTAPRVAVYDGGAVTEGPLDREVVIAPLQQADIVDAALVPEPEPLRYLFADPWDARFLADAIAVDRYVEQLEAGLTGRYGVLPQRPAFYEDFAVAGGLPADAFRTMAPVSVEDRLGPPAAVLVAAIVVEAIVQRAGLPAQAAVAHVRELRERGATWGLIAVSADLRASDLRAVADAALRARQREIAEGRATPVLVPADAGAGAGGDGPAEEPTEPVPPPPPDPSDPDDPGEPQEPPPDDGTLDPVQEPVGEVIDQVGDLLEPVPPLEDAVRDTGEAVDETVDQVDDLLP